MFRQNDIQGCNMCEMLKILKGKALHYKGGVKNSRVV